MISFAALFFGSCTSTEVDAKFDQNATERLSSHQKELNDVLLSSSEGWKAVYYTDSIQLGGWTHLFKFLPDGKVDMASDFNSDTGTYRSQYDIQVGSTVSLVFTTENKIHLLSDANNYPTAALKAKGYLGDFQFYYYGQKNGDIIFRTNRNGHELRFVKATAKDWTDLPKNIPMIKNITGDMFSPLYRLLETNDGTAIHKFDFDYNANARFGKATSLEPGSMEAFDLNFAFTPTGAVSKFPVVVKGQKLTSFIYDSTTNNFVATGANGVSATIKFADVPTILTNDYKIVLPGQTSGGFAYFAKNLTNSASTNSKLFVNEEAGISTNLPKGVGLYSVEIYFNNPLLGNYIYYSFTGGGNAVIHFVDVVEDAVAKKIILKHKSWNGNTVAAAPAYLSKFDQNLVNPSGIYVKKESFKLGNIPNIVYTFTSASSPFRMTIWKI